MAFYRDHFTGIWWTVAAVLIAASLALLASNQVQIGNTADSAEDASATAKRAVVKIQMERAERIDAQDAINLTVCQGNDEQDRLLASLIAAALIGTEDTLPGRRLFKNALIHLRSKPDCTEIVERLTP